MIEGLIGSGRMVGEEDRLAFYGIVFTRKLQFVKTS